MTRLVNWFRRFFFPPPGASRWVRVMPYAVLGAITLALLVSGAYAWDYTNSPQFCGAACHTMPPEYTAYLISPHARVACVECHIGREFIGNQITRKAGDVKHIISLAFRDYHFPITASEMRPARETCERCHTPEKFSDDSLREIKHFGDDEANSPTSIFLVLKTGGGSKRQGLGRGIHWHIENRVLYYPTDTSEQTIPYVRVYKDDGSVDDYLDLESNLDPASIPETALKEMDCITCHNRITHMVNTPEASMDTALARGVIDPAIPEIRRKGVEVLRASYASEAHALNGIAGLEGYYQVAHPDYYANHRGQIEAAIAAIQGIYQQSVFLEQKSDWTTHPNNVGHQDFPGCFRCHGGQHLNSQQHAIRLECNICHSIPVVAGAQQFVTNIEISRGLEPENHKNPNWIALHRTYLDQSCAACHDVSNPGGTDNSSFCSNSACHGQAWTYAGFDAPALAAILAAQLPTPEPTATPGAGEASPTYQGTVRALFEARCGACHGSNAAGGLNLLTYSSAMRGGAGGAAIAPGNVAGSRLVTLQGEKHFANLNADELALVKTWIDDGAPEK